jgi:hypothetical protein
MLTSKEIYKLLQALDKAFNAGKGGYSDDPEIGALQAKLSIMLQVAHQREA